MALHWYLKKEFFDTSDDIEAVFIHYTCSPLGTAPDWSTAETRSMPAGEHLRTGVGEVARYGPPAPVVPQVVHPRLRKKVLTLPNEIRDPETDAYTETYRLHYFYKVIQGGSRRYSRVLTDEIRTREVVFLDPLGVTGGACVNWSVSDWDAPQFAPTEDPRMVDRFGEDFPLRPFKFYGTDNKEAFSIAKKAALDSLPLPHRFSARLSAPVGATVRVRLHTGNGGVPEAQRWEAYWLDESFVMEAGLEPLVLTPLGIEVAPAPQSTVAPELLVGNPYLPFVMHAQAIAAAIETNQQLATEAPVEATLATVPELIVTR
jgi:hypothetical protein